MMKRALDIPEIEEILTAAEQPAPEPPENLLELLKEEIPDELDAGSSGPVSFTSRRPVYLIAATLFLAVFGAVVTYRVRDSLPEPTVAAGADDGPGRSARSTKKRHSRRSSPMGSR